MDEDALCANAMQQIIMDEDALYANAMAGDTDAISGLVKMSDNLRSGNTILHDESRFGNKERVQFLTSDKFADKNWLIKTNQLGQTALHQAIEGGHPDVVAELIHAARSLPSSSANDFDGAFKNFIRQANRWNNTPLHLAVGNCNLAIVELLTAADPADTHVPNSIGDTPLYLAARLGYNDIVKIICRTCIAPSLDGPAGATALHAAIRRLPKGSEEDLPGKTERDMGLFEVLINAAKRSSRSEDASQECFEAILDKTDSDNATILDLAVRENHRDVVELILYEHPAYKPERVDSKRSSLLGLIDIACTKRYYRTYKELCYICEGPVKTTYPGALLFAIKRHNKDFVVRLLEDDDEVVASVDNIGWTPLHHAIDNEFDSVLDDIIKARERVPVYKFLSRLQVGIQSSLAAGHQLESENKVISPLCLAASKGYTSTVLQLFKLLTPSYGDSYNGESLLHFAAYQSNKKMILYILENCPEDQLDTVLNQQNIHGNTPLHLLIRVGCYVPEFIKHKKVRKTLKNDDFYTAYDMLYYQDAVIEDQVYIKETLDDTQESKHYTVYDLLQRWKFWGRSITGKSDRPQCVVPESVVPERRKSKKDQAFVTAKRTLIENERVRIKNVLEKYRSRTNTQIVVTALITTISFTVGFTMPGGYHQSGEPDEGLTLLSKKKSFHFCIVSDALALALSTTTLFIYFISSMHDDPDQVSKLDATSTVLNMVSVIAMMFTFMAASFVVLSHSPGLTITICVICSIFFPFIMYLLVRMLQGRDKLNKLKM